jgi:hypothetical protein
MRRPLSFYSGLLVLQNNQNAPAHLSEQLDLEIERESSRPSLLEILSLKRVPPSIGDGSHESTVPPSSRLRMTTLSPDQRNCEVDIHFNSDEHFEGIN